MWKPIKSAPKKGDFLVYSPKAKKHSIYQASFVGRTLQDRTGKRLRSVTMWHPMIEGPVVKKVSKKPTKKAVKK